METIAARLDIEIFVDCPKCEWLIDLLKEEDTDGVMHDDDGEILRQVFNDHDNFTVDEVTCSKCKTTFNVKELEW